jgi:hypothetical protein
MSQDHGYPGPLQTDYLEMFWLEKDGNRMRYGFARQYQAWRVLERVTPQGHYIQHPECYGTKGSAHMAASVLASKEV